MLQLDELFLEQYGLHINEWSLHLLEVYLNDEDDELNSIYDPSIWEESSFPLVEEVRLKHYLTIKYTYYRNQNKKAR